jgi:PadR family transcriptional regulator PadR
MEQNALHGHLDAMILAAVEHEPLHGYAIKEALQGRSGGQLDVATGTLYPALRRLERAGYLRSAWSTVQGRRRRTYQLTSAGRRNLTAKRSAWRDFAAVVNAVLAPRETPGLMQQ